MIVLLNINPIVTLIICVTLSKHRYMNINKANLRDLIAAAGLVTLFGKRDLEITWMTMKNNHLQTLKSDPYLRSRRAVNH